MFGLYRAQERLSRKTQAAGLWFGAVLLTEARSDPRNHTNCTKKLRFVYFVDRLPDEPRLPKEKGWICNPPLNSELSNANCAPRSDDQLAAATLAISGFLIEPSGLLAASTLTACKLVASSTFSLRSTFAGFSVAAFC